MQLMIWWKLLLLMPWTLMNFQFNVMKNNYNIVWDSGVLNAFSLIYGCSLPVSLGVFIFCFFSISNVRVFTLGDNNVKRLCYSVDIITCGMTAKIEFFQYWLSWLWLAKWYLQKKILTRKLFFKFEI